MGHSRNEACCNQKALSPDRLPHSPTPDELEFVDCNYDDGRAVDIPSSDSSAYTDMKPWVRPDQMKDELHAPCDVAQGQAAHLGASFRHFSVVDSCNIISIIALRSSISLSDAQAIVGCGGGPMVLIDDCHHNINVRESLPQHDNNFLQVQNTVPR